MNLRILPSLAGVAYVLMLSVPTYAQTSEPEVEWTDEEIQLLCSTTGEVAESVMKERLEGVPMSQQMAERLEEPAVPPDLVRVIIIAAYRESVSFSEETSAMNADSVRAFRDGAELGCYAKFYGQDGMGSE